MRVWAKNSVLQAAVVLGLIVSSPAKAVIITGSGIDTLTQRYVIDGAVSSVTHNPGFDFGQPAQSYAISGSFDAQFSHYWWSYYQDGDTNGSQGTFIFEQNWLTFKNANVVGNISPTGFSLPNYFVSLSGPNILGDDSPCSMPSGPNTYCSGNTNGELASVSGKLANGVMSIHGSQPVSDGALYENFSYTIQASAVPEPEMPTMLFCGFFVLMVVARRRSLK